MVADVAGLVLSGRTSGALLREQIEGLAQQHSQVIVDFAGVEIVTPGFADEVFAKMTPSLVETGQVRFAHLDADLSVLRDLVVRQRTRA
jgi:uncharacterized protein DUF4325